MASSIAVCAAYWQGDNEGYNESRTVTAVRCDNQWLYVGREGGMIGICVRMASNQWLYVGREGGMIGICVRMASNQ